MSQPYTLLEEKVARMVARRVVGAEGMWLRHIFTAREIIEETRKSLRVDLMREREQ